MDDASAARRVTDASLLVSDAMRGGSRSARREAGTECSLLAAVLGASVDRSRVELGDTHLLQQGQIVLDVPVVGDAPILDFE